MGNCFGGHPVRHVSGLSNSTVSSALPSTTLSSAENGETISRHSSQAQENRESREKPPCHTGLASLPTSMAAEENSPNYLHAFTYSDLKLATRNFGPDSFVGEGGFGRVFKGNIDKQSFQPAGQEGAGMAIAVKKLDMDGCQGHREWLAELKYLGTLKHPNLVKLIGYCCEKKHRLLVYEFLAQGSLEDHLYGKTHRIMPWFIRLKVAADAARGLNFLHELEKPVIYRDFKASNILLDSEFNAKLSDFGLAKDGPTGDKSHVTTRILGTYGYAAPEYLSTGKLTAKSDVYGFGVVLLEILTGRPALDKDATGRERTLVEWAMPYLIDKQKWSRVLDQELDGQYSRKEAKKAASIALNCLSKDPKKRPTMNVVLEWLEHLVNPHDLPKVSSSCPASQTMSSIGKSSVTQHFHPIQSKYIDSRGREGTFAFHPKPANAFRLPSPKYISSVEPHNLAI